MCGGVREGSQHMKRNNLNEDSEHNLCLTVAISLFKDISNNLYG